MTSIVPECVEDAFEDELMAYTNDAEYRKTRKEINERISSFGSSLPQPLHDDFYTLIDMINDADSRMSTKTFQIGYDLGLRHQNESNIQNLS